MKKILVEDADVNKCAPYGTYIDLTSYSKFTGDGWECWMTEGLCMESYSGLAMCSSEYVQPFEIFCMEKCNTQKMIICGEQNLIVTVSQRMDSMEPDCESIRAFRLKPGSIFVLHPGVWNGAFAGEEEPVEYCMLTGDEKTGAKEGFVKLKGESVQICCII